MTARFILDKQNSRHGTPGAAWWTVENTGAGIQLHYLRHVADTVRVGS